MEQEERKALEQEERKALEQEERKAWRGRPGVEGLGTRREEGLKGKARLGEAKELRLAVTDAAHYLLTTGLRGYQTGQSLSVPEDLLLECQKCMGTFVSTFSLQHCRMPL